MTQNRQLFLNNKKGQYFMYGIHTVLAAANNTSRNIQCIYCLDKYKNKLEPRKLNIPILYVDNHFITQKIGKNLSHQGIIALVTTSFQQGLESIDINLNQKIVILDQVSDPQNIGSIIRSAAAFGIKTVILTKDNSPEENSTIAKAACGCLELVKVIKVSNLKRTIQTLKNNHFWIVGLDASGQHNVDKFRQLNKIAFIIGSEGKGMRRLTAQSCDFLLQIPISRDVESLNASNAASIIFYLMR